MHVANPCTVSRASFPRIHQVGEKETLLPPLLAGKKRYKKTFLYFSYNKKLYCQMNPPLNICFRETNAL